MILLILALTVPSGAARVTWYAADGQVRRWTGVVVKSWGQGMIEFYLGSKKIILSGSFIIEEEN